MPAWHILVREPADSDRRCVDDIVSAPARGANARRALTGAFNHSRRHSSTHSPTLPPVNSTRLTVARGGEPPPPRALHSGRALGRVSPQGAADVDKARRAPCPPANAGPQCHAPRRLRRSLVGVGNGAIHASPVQIQQYISHLYRYSNIYISSVQMQQYISHLYRCSNI